MTDNNSQLDKDKALLTSLIMMLASTAMQQLGKLVNPATGKTEVSLEGARATIDLLEVIKKKTKGNLDKDEEKMLGELLSSLQINYVEVANTTPVPTPPKKEKIEPSNAKHQNDKANEPKDQNTKFHKTYG
ncbi:MAG: DUF1844 domain-containing protein [Lentisphaerae bacterium]|nr:DUF1844 domain-containing protein [Lentisphaerota bacterium]